MQHFGLEVYQGNPTLDPWIRAVRALLVLLAGEAQPAQMEGEDAHNAAPEPA